MTENKRPTLAYLEMLARNAGEILCDGFIKRPGFGKTHRVQHKGVIDLVTEMDKQSEEFLLGNIKERFPNDRIIAEESGELPGEECCSWFVDPLDGTVNYAHGVPIFSVSIAYSVNGDLQLGVVYDPMQDECFSAERGMGALMNGKRIKASENGELLNSLLVTGFAYDIQTNPDNNLDLYAQFSKRSQGVRRIGSAALDLCYVAAGRFDGFWELSLGAWDLAAGALIAEESGAVVSDLNGSEDYLSPPYSILAANKYLHSIMLDLIQDSRNTG